MPSGGMATSSTTVRRWTRGGVVLHHIIDPQTGLPAAGPWRTATVVAASCVDANHLPARLVDRTGTISRIGRWP